MTSGTPSKILTNLKKATACLAVIAFAVAMVPSDAFAGKGGRGGGHGGGYNGGGHGGKHYGGHRGGRSSYRGGYSGGRHYRGHGRHYGGYYGGYYGGRYGYYSNAWVPWAMLGSAVVGYAIADSNRSSSSYSAAQGYSATKPCHMAYRDENQGGELVRMAATMCYDTSGTAYLVQGSEHQVPLE
jgi:hypothetical protein